MEKKYKIIIICSIAAAAVLGIGLAAIIQKAEAHDPTAMIIVGILAIVFGILFLIGIFSKH